MYTEDRSSIRSKPAYNRATPIYRSTVPRMKEHQKIILAIAFATMFMSVVNISLARAEGVAAAANEGITIAQSAPSGQGERGGRPPREALDACASAAAQSACSFSSPDGAAVQGTCMSPEANVPLACVLANTSKKS